MLVALGPVLGTLLSLPLVIWQWNELHHFRETVSTATSFSVVLLTMLLGMFASRSFARHLARRADELHQGVWAALLEVTRAHAQLPRVRVHDAVGEPGSATTDSAHPGAHPVLDTPDDSARFAALRPGSSVGRAGD